MQYISGDRMRRILFLGGPSGVGKSAVCKLIQKKIIQSKKINYYQSMEKIGRLNGLSNKQILLNWEKLEVMLFENVLLPIISRGDLLILDTHYSFQKNISPARAFEKGYYPIGIAVSLSHTNAFIEKLVAERVLIGAICLTAPLEAIINRKLTDENRLTQTSKKTVEIEIVNEKKLWRLMTSRLKRKHAKLICGVISNNKQPSAACDAILSLMKLR